MKKFLQGLTVLACCIAVYFWIEGILDYANVKKVPYPVVAHTFNGEVTGLVINTGKSNYVVNVPLKDYVETRDGDLYYVEERVETKVWWKSLLFETLPVIVIGLFVFIAMIILLAVAL